MRPLVVFGNRLSRRGGQLFRLPFRGAAASQADHWTPVGLATAGSVRRSRGRGERGSVSLELVIIAPAFLLIFVAVIFAGRVAIASQAVHAAAADAARSASLERSAQRAATLGDQAARDSLAGQGLKCENTTTRVDTTGFSIPVGQRAQVSATVSCTVALADLSAPGLPGFKEVTATVISPLDTYRGRES